MAQLASNKGGVAECSGEIEEWKGWSGGGSAILPEMVKVAYTNNEFLSRLLELTHDVWKECTVPSDWRDAISWSPSPRKVISEIVTTGGELLDVVGKVVAKILQERQKLAEDELPEGMQELCRHDFYCSSTGGEILGA